MCNPEVKAMREDQIGRGEVWAASLTTIAVVALLFVLNSRGAEDPFGYRVLPSNPGTQSPF